MREPCAIIDLICRKATLGGVNGPYGYLGLVIERLMHVCTSRFVLSVATLVLGYPHRETRSSFAPREISRATSYRG